MINDFIQLRNNNEERKKQKIIRKKRFCGLENKHSQIINEKI